MQNRKYYTLQELRDDRAQYVHELKLRRQGQKRNLAERAKFFADFLHLVQNRHYDAIAGTTKVHAEDKYYYRWEN